MISSTYSLKHQINLVQNCVIDNSGCRRIGMLLSVMIFWSSLCSHLPEHYGVTNTQDRQQLTDWQCWAKLSGNLKKPWGSRILNIKLIFADRFWHGRRKRVLSLLKRKTKKESWNRNGITGGHVSKHEMKNIFCCFHALQSKWL